MPALPHGPHGPHSDTLAYLPPSPPARRERSPRLEMPVTIRSRLLLLVLSVLLPGMLGVSWLIGSTYAAEREAHDRNLRATARALSMLVDSELSRRATIASVLSQSPALDGTDLPPPERLQAFEQQARRVMQDMAGWVELRAPGRLLLSTRQPEGMPQMDMAAPATLLATAQMLPLQPLPRPAGAVGEPHGDELAAAWVEPVLRDGQLLYNLVVTIQPSELQRIVQSQANPGWIGTVMDNAGRVVARQPGGISYAGRAVRDELRQRMALGTEGSFQAVALDGMPTAGYFSTSPLGWSYVTAMPLDAYAGRLPNEVVRVVAGALALGMMALLGALWVARRIERPIRTLKSAAQALQAGRHVPGGPTGMVECDEVAEALATAGRTMAGSRAELERSVAQAVERTRVMEQRGAQSQRVEALGRLTGGVAHEFNNLLGIVSNSMHLIQRHAAAVELQAPLGATQRAVARGSQLTQHLLRVSGHRTGVRLQTLSLARYLPEVQELLRSVLGRRIDIQVHVDPDVAPVRVDASELDLALLNLALNAHDAMPRGGELRLRAAPATADDMEGLPQLAHTGYVLLTVGDDGVGMDAELAARAFEPFFTTKPVGQGSGLGLSQVYGFATQAGGTARLASTPGLGTTVSLLLPAAQGDEPQPAVVPPAVEQGLAGATVLLVEDEEALADVTTALLAAQGARVLRASQADAALRLLEAGATVDLVLSDIVMPGALDGVALARRLRELRPGLPVTLITGFSNTAIADGEFTVLRKPCAPAELLAALQAAWRAARAPRPH